MTTGRWIGIDFGLSRVGVAVSDLGASLARGLETIRWNGRNTDVPLGRILTLCRELEAVGLVVGLPRRTDGKPGESEQLARAFAAALEQRSELPVALTCERYTTTLASHYLRESGRKTAQSRSVIDQVAAEILLQDFLDQARRATEPYAIMQVDSSDGIPDSRTHIEEDKTMTADEKKNIPGMNADQPDLDEACGCGHNHQHDADCGCGDDCDCDDEGCGDDCDCDCGCGHEDGESVITMTDAETGDEYRFILADDFVFEDENYCVLVSADNDDEPEMVIARVVELEDGSEGLETLSDDEYDRVYAEYERICEEEDEEEEEEDDEADEVGGADQSQKR